MIMIIMDGDYHNDDDDDDDDDDYNDEDGYSNYTYNLLTWYTS